MTKLFAVVFACSLSALEAQNAPSMLKVGMGDLPVVKTQKGFTTIIIAPEQQEISEVSCGDHEYWVVEGKGRFLHIKPAKEGAVTNLNIILNGTSVHSFLLKEISKEAGGKEKPDMKVYLEMDDLAKAGQDKARLEAVLLRTERKLSERKAQEETEKQQAQKKSPDEAVRSMKQEEVRKSDPSISDVKVVAEAKAKVVAPVLTPALDSKDSAHSADAAPEKPDFTAFTVDYAPADPIVHRQGLLRVTGRFLGRIFRKVGQTLRLY